jgi:hypothetical protein
LCSTARAERPPTDHLVLAGLGMAPPVYFLGVATHEGSHALMAKFFGAELVEFHVLPGFYGRNKDFHFGYTLVRGLKNDTQRTWFWIAPKLTDLIMLGAYSSLVLTDTLPENRYAQLALATTATGFWVDFSKDVIAFWPSNDIVKAMNANGLENENSRLPIRLLHVSLSVASALVIWRGYEKVFADDEGSMTAPVLIPLAGGSF